MRSDPELRQTIFQVLRVAVASRVSVLLVGYMAVNAIGFPNRAYLISENRFHNLPARWDTGWYLGIAEDGYEYDPRVSRQQSVVFFPGYPGLTRAASEMLTPLLRLAGVETHAANLTQLLWIGVGISVGAFCLALTYLARMSRRYLDAGQTQSALMLLAAYPFATYFSAHYSEGLFLLAVAAAFFHVEQGNGARTAAWAVLAGLTRPNGFLLSGPLLIAVWERHWRGQSDARNRRHALLLAIASAASLLGTIAFSFHIYQLTGDPLHWLKAQAAWGRSASELIPFASEYRHVAEHGLYDLIVNQPLRFLNSLAAIVVLCLIVPIIRRFGWAYGAFVAINVIPPLLTSVTSMARFSSVLFPIFFWMGAKLRPDRAINWIVVFAIGQGFIAVMFFSWRHMY